MSATRFSFGRVMWIARNTLREAIRQRLFSFLAVFAVVLVVSAQLLGEFNFGASVLKFLTDFGFGALTFFGSLLAIVASAQLFFGEIENRTALTLLAKPVRRSEFVLGKFCGVWVVLALFCALVGGTLLTVLVLRTRALGELDPEVWSHVGRVPYHGVVLFIALQWFKFGVLAAVTMLIASYAHTILFTIFSGFLVMVICHLQHLAQDAWHRAEHLGVSLASAVLAIVFPNFQVFNVGDRVAEGGTISLVLAGRIAGYGAIYIVVLLGLAVFLFRRREV